MPETVCCGIDGTRPVEVVVLLRDIMQFLIGLLATLSMPASVILEIKLEVDKCSPPISVRLEKRPPYRCKLERWVVQIHVRAPRHVRDRNGQSPWQVAIHCMYQLATMGRKL
jgi:hypothetical protein